MNFGDDYIEVNPYKYDAEMPKEQPKYRLVDILNKIANGELKEGTKVKIRDNIYEFTKQYRTDIAPDLVREDYEYKGEKISIFEDFYLVSILTDEVELIEPQEPTECEHEWENYGMYNPNTGETKDFRKCAKCDLEEYIEPTDNTKIEELDILEIEDSQNIDNIGLANSIGDLRNEIREIQHKLNEVIRVLNKRRG